MLNVQSEFKILWNLQRGIFIMGILHQYPDISLLNAIEKLPESMYSGLWVSNY